MSGERILAISAHPDDETLGCGGTLLRRRTEGAELHWVVVTEAFTPRWSQEVIDEKAAEVVRVGEAFGMSSVTKLGHPTTQLEMEPLGEIIDGIRKAVERVRPTTVYIVHPGDVHTDHRVVFTAAMSVLKPFYMAAFGVREVFCFETLSSTDAAPMGLHAPFVPTAFVEVTGWIDEKIEIMRMFGTEAQSPHLPRGDTAIRALARFRGAAIAVEYAEAFQLIRSVDALSG